MIALQATGPATQDAPPPVAPEHLVARPLPAVGVKAGMMSAQILAHMCKETDFSPLGVTFRNCVSLTLG